MTAPRAWISDRIAEIETALRPLCAPGERHALLDWPAHSNVGDSAIWLGNLVLLRRLTGRLPDLVTPGIDLAEGLAVHLPDGPIFMHGGGNFGDIWAGVHGRRLHVLETQRHRRIVQLPQSIRFRPGGLLDRTRRAIAAHPDFTLLVRDRASLDFARAHFDCESLLCPDAALMLGPLAPPAPPLHDVFALLRDDPERATEGASVWPLGPVEDWIDEPVPVATGLDRAIRWVYWKSLSRRAPRFIKRPMMRQHERMCLRHADKRLERGLELLSRGRVVVTDRLHAHILCTLMGRPHVVLDNSYGKLGNFITTWPDDGLTRRARDIAEAVDLAREMLHAGRDAPDTAARQEGR